MIFDVEVDGNQVKFKFMNCALSRRKKSYEIVFLLAISLVKFPSLIQN